MKLNKSNGGLEFIRQLGKESSDTELGYRSGGHQKCNSISLNDSEIFCTGFSTDSFAEEYTGRRDVIFMKINKDNTLRNAYVKQLGKETFVEHEDSYNSGFYDDSCEDIAVDSTGIYCTGSSRSSLFEENGGNLSSDVMIIKFNFNGGLEWSIQLGKDHAVNGLFTNSIEKCTSIALDDSGLYCSGNTVSKFVENHGGRRCNFYKV